MNIKTFSLKGADYTWVAEAYDANNNTVGRMTGMSEADVKARLEDYLRREFTATVVSDYVFNL